MVATTWPRPTEACSDFGNLSFWGSMGGTTLASPIVGVGASSGGYYLVAADGGVFSYGVPFLGSKGGQTLNKPVVGMAVGAGGYYLVGADGGVFNYGSPFLGSQGGQTLSAPIAGMAESSVTTSTAT